MSDGFYDAFFAFLGVVVTGLMGLAVAKLNRVQTAAETTQRVTEETHVMINSRMDQLIEAKGTSERAKGEAIGRADLKAEQKADKE